MAARAETGTSRVSTAKISIGSGSGLFGDIGGKAFTTPTFELSEGGLTRSNTEFLNE